MSKKGYSSPGFFGGINHYDEQGKKQVTAILVYLAAIITMTVMAEKQVILIRDYSVDIIIMIITEIKPDVPIPDFSEVIIIMIQKANLQAQVIRLSLEDIIIILPVAVIQRQPFTDHMIVLKFGHSAVIGITFLRPLGTAELLYAYTML